ncbi:MAG: hypothetical protein A2848_01355 [Candidatus Magasanikbacteria bacterium RIFCSPHIGHO2_01_FULL_50_8]|uniref:Transcription regulator TrmB N-terminal domain-containing protein n=2 Tax=Candidatus Magasanikiibacteriota TaxID=1752731 RepID=A0A1F6LS07_9BACT|nr:MAG: hypothetical protein A2848_01355 [Candidatus Magasanikbacteria bacterium RIFCSPHIGHO2_01_FULL_50_8]OGH67830.1 MAG: hypothetical protein A3C15_02105 [Candidatus Magasanikbacteria bacterium RIFCSPHIGHO2_02_FULL_50_9b]
MKYSTEELNQILKHFGCTTRDIKVYLKALSFGPGTIQQYAHSFHENRITVHSAIERLIEKKLMFESRKGKRRIVAAADPTIFQKMLQQEKNEIGNIEPSLAAAVQWLQGIKKIDASTPAVKFYEGITGLKHMLEESLEAKSEVLVFTYVDIFADLLNKKYLENYYERRAKLGIHTRLIFPNAEFGKQIYSRAESFNMKIKFLPGIARWNSGFFLWNDVLAIQSFTEGKVTCTIIQNEDIAHFFRNVIFPLCWEGSRELSRGQTAFRSD